MPELTTSVPVLAQPPLCSRAAAPALSPTTQISQNHPQPAAPRGNPNRSPKPPNLDRRTASIPSPKCLILKARNLPNPGKNTFHILDQLLDQPSSKAPQPARGIWRGPTRLTAPSFLCFLYLRHLHASLPEVA